jgi:hypothetical protein
VQVIEASIAGSTPECGHKILSVSGLYCLLCPKLRGMALELKKCSKKNKWLSSSLRDAAVNPQ